MYVDFQAATVRCSVTENVWVSTNPQFTHLGTGVEQAPATSPVLAQALLELQPRQVQPCTQLQLTNSLERQETPTKHLKCCKHPSQQPGSWGLRNSGPGR